MNQERYISLVTKSTQQLNQGMRLYIGSKLHGGNFKQLPRHAKHIHVYKSGHTYHGSLLCVIICHVFLQTLHFRFAFWEASFPNKCNGGGTTTSSNYMKSIFLLPQSPQPMVPCMQRIHLLLGCISLDLQMYAQQTRL